jgi:hypothetical protein
MYRITNRPVVINASVKYGPIINKYAKLDQDTKNNVVENFIADKNIISIFTPNIVKQLKEELRNNNSPYTLGVPEVTKEALIKAILVNTIDFYFKGTKANSKVIDDIYNILDTYIDANTLAPLPFASNQITETNTHRQSPSYGGRRRKTRKTRRSKKTRKHRRRTSSR